jgi:hypothetical protein
MAYLFEEHIFTKGNKTFIDGHVSVRVDNDGYFVFVNTDDYEGNAMMTLPCARKCLSALRRAIRAAELKRKATGPSTPSETPKERI